nr:hypothetical protein CFP56_56888 [Quercus suber]
MQAVDDLAGRRGRRATAVQRHVVRSAPRSIAGQSEQVFGPQANMADTDAQSDRFSNRADSFLFSIIYLEPWRSRIIPFLRANHHDTTHPPLATGLGTIMMAYKRWLDSSLATDTTASSLSLDPSCRLLQKPF